MSISFLSKGYLQIKYENKIHNDIFKIIYCKYNIHILGNPIYNAAMFLYKHGA